MGVLKISLFLVCVLDIMMAHSLAQNSPEEYLQAHNDARAEVGVAPLVWDNTVAAYAQGFTNNELNNDCQLVHSGGRYGENLAWNKGNMSVSDVVQLWLDEKQNYDFNTHSCAPDQVCVHYMQVVSKNSVRLGCAKVRCKDNLSFFTICNYDPPGNTIGQRPYGQGVYTPTPLCTPIYLNMKNHIPL